MIVRRDVMSVVGQGLVVVMVSAIGAFAIGRARYGSPINLMWIVCLPIAIAMFFNSGYTRRILVAVGLVFLSVVTVLALAERAGLGPS